MTFLAPTAGLIAAAIAVPGLVFFYLLKLRRRPVRVSSTLLWQKATHDLQVNAPLRWPRLTWLFLLQLLALAALIMALARPAIDGGGPEASRIVLVIDRSASMSATDGRDPRTGAANGGSRLDEAKGRAEEVIDRLRYAGGARRARSMVVALGADARALTGFTDSPAALRDAIRSIAPSDQPGDLQSALRLLASLSAGQADEESSRERTAVYIFSDGAFTPPAAGGPFTAPGIGGIDIRLNPVGPPPTGPGDAASEPPPAGNLGIVAISARRDHEDPVIARVFVRVQNAAAEPARTTLQLRVGPDLVDSRAVEVPPRTISSAGRVEPGQAAATFEINRPTGGLVAVSLSRADALEADNAAAVVLGDPARPGVLVVAPEGRADPFFMSVLEEMDLQRLTVVDEAAYESRAAANGIIQGEGLDGFDLILFDRTEPRTLPPLPTISFGAGLPIPGLSVSPVEGPGASGAGAANFLAWRRTHPVLRYVSLDPIIVNPPMLVSLPAEVGTPPPPLPAPLAPPTPPTPDQPLPPPPQAGAAPVTASQSLAEGPHGPLMGLVEQGAVRRIIVGFELARSTWGPDVSFPVFMANAVEYLTLRGESAAGRAFSTGEPVAVTPAPGAQTIDIAGPLRASIDVPEVAGGERPRVVPIGVLDRAGVYRLTGTVPTDSMLAVNLVESTESMLATATALDIAGAGGGTTPREGAEAGPREIWHWFVLLALLLTSLEWLIYAWRMRP